MLSTEAENLGTPASPLAGAHDILYMKSTGITNMERRRRFILVRFWRKQTSLVRLVLECASAEISIEKILFPRPGYEAAPRALTAFRDRPVACAADCRGAQGL